MAAQLVVLTSLPSHAAEKDALASEKRAEPLAAFPAAEDGMTRHVIQLPAQEIESDFKVELVLGKTVVTDEANRYFFSGQLETRTLEGWGYSFYVLPQIGPMAGTLMAVPADAPKSERFIAIGGEPLLIRYNSRLPVVVYAPEGVEVRYRLWRGDTETSPIEKG